MIQHLITGGCSFSHSQNSKESWIGFLEKNLKLSNSNLTIEHTGFLSQGQELIQKKVTLAVMDALQKGIPASDILVVVMWSGTYRKAWYIDNEFILNKMRNLWKNFEGGMSGQFLDLKNNIVGDIEKFQTKNGTEFNSAKNGGWYFTVNGSDCPLEFVQQHYLLDGHLSGGIGKVHISLENIVMLQNFCKLNGINIVHQFFMDSVYDDIEVNKDHQLINYLYKQLDFNDILKDGMFEYLHHRMGLSKKDASMISHDDRKELDKPFGYFNKDGFHPSIIGSKLWCDDVLLPFLKKRLK